MSLPPGLRVQPVPGNRGGGKSVLTEMLAAWLPADDFRCDADRAARHAGGTRR